MSQEIILFKLMKSIENINKNRGTSFYNASTIITGECKKKNVIIQTTFSLSKNVKQKSQLNTIKV